MIVYGFDRFLGCPVFCGIQRIAFHLNVKLMHGMIFVYFAKNRRKNYFIFGSIEHRASFPSKRNAINLCIEKSCGIRYVCTTFRMLCKQFVKLSEPNANRTGTEYQNVASF